MGIIYSSNHKTNSAVGNEENDYVIIMKKNENNYDVSIGDILPIVDSNCPSDVSVKDTIVESKPINEINCPCDSEPNFVINPLNDIKKKKKKRKNKNK
jgi:hypothetical protein